MKKILLAVFVSTLFITNSVTAQFSVAVDSTNPGCNQSNGSARVTASGGSNYTYKWSTGATSASVSNLGAGSYTVTVYSTGNAGGAKYDTTFLETFDGNTNSWTLNTQIGYNGDDHNFWEIGDKTGGSAVGSCATYSQNGNGDKKLYITNTSNSSYPGAQYDAGSGEAAIYCDDPIIGLIVNCTETALSATSPNISTIGKRNLILTYDCIGLGEKQDISDPYATSSDSGSSYYSIDGGTTYQPLELWIKSDMCGVNGKWTRKSFYLPANALNISNLKIQFRWVNDNSATGGDPSVGINNILIRDSTSTIAGGTDSIVKTFNLAVAGSAGPVTISPANPPTFCANESVTLCATEGFTSYKWNNQVDTARCRTIRTVGNYTVTATDANGCTVASNRVPVDIYPVPSVSIIVRGDTLTSFGAVAYQWFKNEVAISGATSATYIAKEAGQYSVEITDNNGCKTRSSNVALAVDELSRDVNFSIYPNPASTNNLQLAITTECMGCSIEVFDATGKLVHESKVRAPKQEIDISSLAKGIYIVKVAGGIRKFVRD